MQDVKWNPANADLHHSTINQPASHTEPVHYADDYLTTNQPASPTEPVHYPDVHQPANQPAPSTELVHYTDTNYSTIQPASPTEPVHYANLNHFSNQPALCTKPMHYADDQTVFPTKPVLDADRPATPTKPVYYADFHHSIKQSAPPNEPVLFADVHHSTNQSAPPEPVRHNADVNHSANQPTFPTESYADVHQMHCSIQLALSPSHTVVNYSDVNSSTCSLDLPPFIEQKHNANIHLFTKPPATFTRPLSSIEQVYYPDAHSSTNPLASSPPSPLLQPARNDKVNGKVLNFLLLKRNVIVMVSMTNVYKIPVLKCVLALVYKGIVVVVCV